VKNRYLVKITVANRDALSELLDSATGAESIEIEVIANAFVAPKTARPTGIVLRQNRAPRTRRSKVNAAILGAMNHGPATKKTLKSALENAGMSASSLSTGIAALIKSGQIERVGEGEYGVKAA
jgi:hypothetical protein